MALIGELRPFLGEIARSLRILVKQSCGNSNPIAATSATADPATILAGFSKLSVTKTSAAGTVTIGFPNGDTYELTADGEEFVIEGNLGQFTITGAGGATFKYFAS